MLFAGCSEKSQNENKKYKQAFFFFNLVFIDLDLRATAKNSASVENYQTFYQYSIIACLELQALDKSQREHPI